MDFDKDLMREIAAMPDEALKNGIFKVAQNMGVDPMMASAYLSDMGRIKNAISGLTEEDLEKICQNFGEDRINDIVSNIKNELGKS
jgi:hypothetical protein